jgi:tRNA(Ile)-lysidine synthase
MYTSMLSLSEKMKYTGCFIEQEVSKRVEWNKTTEGYTTNFENFVFQPDIIKIESWYRVYNELFPHSDTFRLPYRFLRPLLSIDLYTTNGVCIRGYGIVVRRKEEQLDVEYDVATTSKKGYFRVFAGGGTFHIVKNLYLHAEKKVVSYIREDEIVLSENMLSPPLVVRSRKPGDEISLKGGKKSLKKLFNEWNVPEGLRWEIPVIQDRKEIIAVAGNPFGYKNRVAQQWKKCNINDSSIIIRFLLFKME